MLCSALMKFLFALLALVVTTFAAAPEVSAPAVVVGVNGSAVLSAKVKTNGSGTTVTFKYGIGADRSQTKVVTLAQATAEQTATAALTGLMGNVTYHFEINAENTDGPTPQEGLDFTLVQTVPVLSGVAAQTGSDGTASLSVKVKTNGTPTTVTFHYGIGTDRSLTKTVTVADALTVQTASVVLTGLQSGATYHFDVLAENATGVSVPLEDQDFHRAPTLTAVPVPTVVTGKADLSVKVFTNGGTTVVTFTYRIGSDFTKKDGNIVVKRSLSDATTEQTAVVKLTSLVGGVQYFFKVEATNQHGTSKLGTVAFDVPKYPPTILIPDTNTKKEHLLAGKATIRAQVTENGYPTTVQFEYGDAKDAYAAPVAIEYAAATEPPTTYRVAANKLEGLKRGNTYHYKFIVTYNDSTETPQAAAGIKMVLSPDQTFTATANQAPVALPDLVIVHSHAPVLIDVLANDTDPEGDGLTLKSDAVTVTKSGLGTLEVVGNKVRYTPSDSPTKADSFTYTVTDNFTDSPRTATGKVTIKAPGLAAQGLHSAVLKDQHGKVVGQLRFMGTEGGALSGKVELYGKSFALLGTLDADGNASISVPRPGTSPLSLKLAFDQTDTASTLKVDINSGKFTAEATLSALTASRLAELQGRYTVQLPGAGGTGSTLPQGTGYVRLDVQTSGDVSIRGQLGDGEKIHARAVLGGLDGAAAVNIYLAPKNARVNGTLLFGTGEDPSVTGTINWTRPARSNTDLFPDGFETSVSATGGAYIAPLKGRRALDGNDKATITLTGGNLGGTITHKLDLNSRDGMEVLDPSGDQLKVKVDRGAGTFHGSFTNPTTGDNTPINGVLLQSESKGVGVFPGSSQTGTVSYTIGTRAAATGTGNGTGTGAGTGSGTGSGTGNLTLSGNGTGTTSGTGTGNGIGTGNGNGTGTVFGNTTGTGTSTGFSGHFVNPGIKK